jgi:hypothetical protein
MASDPKVAEPVPRPNPSETREFLDRLPHAEREHLVVIGDGVRLKGRTFFKQETAEAVGWLSASQGSGNCYFHVNVLREGFSDGKATRDDVVAVRMLHVDIDDVTALERIRTFGLPPSVTIFSGGGYQCFWFLDAPSKNLELAEALNTRIAEMLGGDKCHNLDRVMRVPGTLNVPNRTKRAKGRELALAYVVGDLTDYDLSYALSDVDQLIRASRTPARRASLTTDLTLAAPVSVEDLTLPISDFTRALIRSGDDEANPRGGPNPTYPSRSEAVMRAACDLAAANADEALIVGVLIDARNGISASILEKRDPIAYAARQALRAFQFVGEGWPQMVKGRATATFGNALVAISRLGVRCEFDEFRNRYRVSGDILGNFSGELTDDACTVIRHEALVSFGFDPGKEHLRDACLTLCLDNAVHPIRAYLDRLVWDGKPRLDRWLTTYLGAGQNDLHGAMGRLILIAAVRRIRSPGAKFDTILVLEGRQGSGKSQAVIILAGEENFSDQPILQADTKTQMEALEGVWIYELPELQGLKMTDVEKLKAFLSRRFDRGRAAYARFAVVRPRQSVFIGTTNESHYLRDATGNRRFWPVETGVIDLDGLRADRDQLFAEACTAEEEGLPLTLPEELWPAAEEAQEGRMLIDPWLDLLGVAEGEVVDQIERITTQAVMRLVSVDVDRQTQFDFKRIAPLMRKHGWNGPKSIRSEKRVVQGYERPAPGLPDRPMHPPY